VAFSAQHAHCTNSPILMSATLSPLPVAASVNLRLASLGKSFSRGFVVVAALKDAATLQMDSTGAAMSMSRLDILAPDILHMKATALLSNATSKSNRSFIGVAKVIILD
jgi:hypothetical protein